MKVTPQARQAWRGGTAEKSADAMAEDWMRYANAHYYEYERPGYTKFGMKLLALINKKG